MMGHVWEIDEDGARFCVECCWYENTDRGRAACEGNRRERATRELMAAVLLTPVPDWPQPADPFSGLPRAERATSRGDWVL